MATNIEWHLGTGGGATRGRVRVSDFAVGQADLDAEIVRRLLEAAGRSARRLEEVAHDVYATLRGLHAYTSRSPRGILAGLTIADPRFFFHEFDTRPHWPPFGKYSELAAWAREHGMDSRAAFFIARKMAPEGATDAVMGPYTWRTRSGKEIQRTHRMTVGGLGGSESQHRPPRMVATSGKYALSDALDVEAELLADECTAIISALIADVLPEGNNGL